LAAGAGHSGGVADAALRRGGHGGHGGHGVGSNGEERYPVFVRSKQAWESLLGGLPPQVSNAIKHYISPTAQRVMGKMTAVAISSGANG
jgi:hypothetical protein